MTLKKHVKMYFFMQQLPLKIYFLQMNKSFFKKEHKAEI